VDRSKTRRTMRQISACEALRSMPFTMRGKGLSRSRARRGPRPYPRDNHLTSRPHRRRWISLGFEWWHHCHRRFRSRSSGPTT
jgi:hypothetical protein